MKKLDVYLNLSPRLHPIYLELVNYPPPNVNYISPNIKDVYSQNSQKGRERMITSVMRFMYSQLPAVYYVRNTRKARLIHSTSNFMILNNQPWVVDTEHIGGFIRFHNERYRSSIYRKIVSALLKKKTCRAILPWSAASKKSILSYLPNEPSIENKCKTIYPAIHISDKMAKKPKERFRFLFVGRVFYEKGGREALEAFIKTKSLTDCSLTYVGTVPDEVKEKYSKDVDFIEPKLDREKMAGLFVTHHALLFPTYMDTFGFVILEAMAAGLPVISTEVFCIPEIIEDGISGLLIKPPIRWHDERYLHDYGRFPKWKDFVDQIESSKYPAFVDSLHRKMHELSTDSTLWSKLSKGGLERVSRGPFSIAARNKSLEEIYNASL